MKNKKILIIPLILILALLSGCSDTKEITENNVRTNNISQNTAVRETVETKQAIENNLTTANTKAIINFENQNSVRDESNTLVTLQKISRKASGLNSIVLLDFSKFSLNNRISTILKNLNIYRDEDYKNGLIEVSDGLLISRGFQKI